MKNTKNILVTGGAGFIGSNFIKHILSEYPNYVIVNVDKLTYAGNIRNLNEVQNFKNYFFYNVDISDKTSIYRIFEEHKIDTVVNFAAESHVDRSIENPLLFLETNIIGTQNLLNASVDFWRRRNDKYCKEYLPEVKFVQISTDEVYGSLGDTGLFSENSLIKPNSPYSASKASADLLVRSYHHTYGLPMNITRCSNNYGPNQFPEKLIPLMILNCLKDKSLPIYGDGMQIRDWIHVEDHCRAIDKVLHHGNSGEVYNVGGEKEIKNIDLVKTIIKLLNKSEKLITYVKDRPGHDRRYAIDNSKIKNEIGWSPIIDFEDGLSDTINWYLSNSEWIEEILNGDYLNYYSKMYEKTSVKE